MIEVENLKPEETYKFIANAFRDGELQSTGTAFTAILMPVNMFIKENHVPEKIYSLGEITQLL
jgi:type I restriction enzyme, R subunit